jgi:hypothetical protein
VLGGRTAGPITWRAICERSISLEPSTRRATRRSRSQPSRGSSRATPIAPSSWIIRSTTRKPISVQYSLALAASSLASPPASSCHAAFQVSSRPASISTWESAIGHWTACLVASAAPNVLRSRTHSVAILTASWATPTARAA